MSDSTFTGNVADGDGGGLVGVIVAVSDGTFTGNEAQGGDGGGFDSDEATVTASSFSGNSSSRDGGAFWAEDPSTVAGSTFDSNTSERDGGAVFTEDELTVSNSTFSSNATSGRGGAIAAEAEPLELRFVTMAANRAEGGGADVATFELAATLDVDGSVFASTGSCDLAGATAGADNFDGGETCGLEEANNIVDGGDPGLDPLADNGGATSTRLPGAASPLLLAISETRCATLASDALATDQRGGPRPSPSGARCTIGSVNTAAAAPGAPVEVATSSGPEGVALSWSAPLDDGGSAVTSYLIESSTDGAAWSGVTGVAASAAADVAPAIGFVAAATDTAAPSAQGAAELSGVTQLGATSIMLPAAAEGTTVRYRVAAVNAVGQGPYSRVASVDGPAPAVPTGDATSPEATGDRGPTSLAFTGSEPIRLVEFAAMLAVIGLAVLIVARRVRRGGVDGSARPLS